MDKQTQAQNYFKEGYNCCQAVVLAFADEVKVDKDTLLMIASSFGGGMGRLREVCGAVSAMFIIEGLKDGYTLPNDRVSKAELYKRIQKLAEEFKKLNGTIICRELLKSSEVGGSPETRTPEYYKKRPCVELVGQAAKIIENAEKENLF
ncbi:MAG: C-GCAxxG-C-C family protein [Clostridia bacterium]